jgi:hypothetical protein
MEHPDSFDQDRVRRPFRSDKPSHVTSRASGPSHEGDERDYAQFLTCCF